MCFGISFQQSVESFVCATPEGVVAAARSSAFLNPHPGARPGATSGVKSARPSDLRPSLLPDPGRGFFEAHLAWHFSCKEPTLTRTIHRKPSASGGLSSLMAGSRRAEGRMPTASLNTGSRRAQGRRPTAHPGARVFRECLVFRPLASYLRQPSPPNRCNKQRPTRSASFIPLKSITPLCPGISSAQQATDTHKVCEQDQRDHHAR